MSHQPGDIVKVRFFTRHTDTGALTDADSLPTGSLIRNGVVDAAVTVTIANVTTGEYNFQFTLPSTYVRGDLFECMVSATVDSTADKSIVHKGVVDEALGLEFTVDTSSVSATTTSFGMTAGPDGDDELNDGFVQFTTGNLAGLPPIPIHDYTATNFVASFATAWPEAPANGDKGIILGRSL